jgi:hypothetical protein
MEFVIRLRCVASEFYLVIGVHPTMRSAWRESEKKSSCLIGEEESLPLHVKLEPKFLGNSTAESTQCVPGLLHVVEGGRSRHPHPAAGQGGVREAAVKSARDEFRQSSAA